MEKRLEHVRLLGERNAVCVKHFRERSIIVSSPTKKKKIKIFVQ